MFNVIQITTEWSLQWCTTPVVPDFAWKKNWNTLQDRVPICVTHFFRKFSQREFLRLDGCMKQIAFFGSFDVWHFISPRVNAKLLNLACFDGLQNITCNTLLLISFKAYDIKYCQYCRLQTFNISIVAALSRAVRPKTILFFFRSLKIEQIWAEALVLKNPTIFSMLSDNLKHLYTTRWAMDISWCL